MMTMNCCTKIYLIKILYLIITCFIGGILLASCRESKQDKMMHLVKKWNDKTIVFPQQMTFTAFRGDSVVECKKKYSTYAIVTYVDSIGCMSCKLKLSEWGDFMSIVDSISKRQVPCLYFFHPKKKSELISLLKRTRFTYPVCIDENDSLNILNGFPSDMMYQTFLIDKDNKVLAIGNPVHNPMVKDLYINIISGKQPESTKKQRKTEVIISENLIDLGEFFLTIPQHCTFTLKNVGDDLLVIDDVITSCGCTSVVYSREPVQPGKSLDLAVTYKADHPEHFNKTITVYCNVLDSPLQLKITGDAQ